MCRIIMKNFKINLKQLKFQSVQGVVLIVCTGTNVANQHGESLLTCKHVNPKEGHMIHTGGGVKEGEFKPYLVIVVVTAIQATSVLPIITKIARYLS